MGKHDGWRIRRGCCELAPERTAAEMDSRAHKAAGTLCHVPSRHAEGEILPRCPDLAWY